METIITAATIVAAALILVGLVGCGALFVVAWLSNDIQRHINTRHHKIGLRPDQLIKL